MSFEDDEKAGAPEGDEGAAAIAQLMDWLKDKPEDAWLECVDHFVSDDDAGWTLLAIVDHPRCTKQVAAYVFWSRGPYETALRLIQGESLEPEIDEGEMIIDRVLRNWHSDFYRVGEIELEAPGDLYRRDILKGNSADPLNIPADLLGSFAGRKVTADSRMAPFGSPYFWDAYCSEGLDYACRPNDYEARFAAERADRKARSQPNRALGLALVAVSLSLLGLLLYFR